MDWDCCLFCHEPKSEKLRGRVKASSKEKADREKKKIEETYKKTASLMMDESINLLNKTCFWWKNSLVIIMNRQYSKYLKQTMQSTITITFQTISRN